MQAEANFRRQRIRAAREEERIRRQMAALDTSIANLSAELKDVFCEIATPATLSGGEPEYPETPSDEDSPVEDDPPTPPEWYINLLEEEKSKPKPRINVGRFLDVKIKPIVTFLKL